MTLMRYLPEDSIYHGNLFPAQPDVRIMVAAEAINGTHYQSVSCSADGGRPTPQISWLVGGRPPPAHPFTVDESKTLHPNGTSTLSSVLRFPTRLQDEESVTCVVQHPTLPHPKLTTARVETYGEFVFTSASLGSSVWCVASPLGGLQSSFMTQHLTTL